MKGDKFISVVMAAKAANKASNKTIVFKNCADVTYSYEEALELAGNGKYNLGLLVVLSLVLMSMGSDMFSFSLVITGCSCEFQLTQAQKGILNAIPFGGPILTAYMWGYISDTQGRRKCLLIGMSLSFVYSVLSSLSPNWIVLGILKFLSTSSSSCAQSATYTLLGESCNPKVSRPSMLLMGSFIQVTPSFFFGIAYFILGLEFSYDLGFLHYTPWRLYVIILSTPLLLGLSSLLFFYESPKFLANQGQEDKALDILRNIYRRNGGNPDEYPVKKLAFTETTSRRTDINFLRSIWEQCAPLFRPPLLTRTLKLFFITAVIYGSSNSFFVWFPIVANSFFSTLKSGGGDDSSLCTLLSSDDLGSGNVTVVSIKRCSSALDDYTVFSGVATGICFMFVSGCLAALSAYKKTVTILILLTSCAGAVGVLLATEPVSVIFFYVLFCIDILGIGLMSSYYVELFPTSHRGMVACLSVVVARASALSAVGLVGAFIRSHCQPTFIAGCLYVFSGVVVACFLPSDSAAKLLK